MSLYFLTPNAWGVDWRDEYGRRHRRLVGSREAAAALEQQLLQNVAQARNSMRTAAARADLTLTQASEVWAAHSPWAAKTRQLRLDRIRILAQAIGNLQISLITPTLLQKHAAHRSTLLAPASAAKENEIIHQFFDWLTRNAYAGANPAATLKRTVPPHSSGRAITEKEERLILEATTPRAQLKILLTLDAGLRPGEAGTLNRNNLDLEGKWLHLRSNKPPHRPKSIPMTNRLLRILKSHAAHLMPDAPLFPTRSRKEPDHDAFWQKLKQRTGIQARYHDLRHTFATRLMEATNNPFLVANLLGHSLSSQMAFARGIKLPTTTPRYLHPSPEQLRAAIDRMEQQNPLTAPPAAVAVTNGQHEKAHDDGHTTAAGVAVPAAQKDTPQWQKPTPSKSASSNRTEPTPALTSTTPKKGRSSAGERGRKSSPSIWQAWERRTS